MKSLPRGAADVTPLNRLATIHQRRPLLCFILTWHTNVIDRQNNGPVAYGEPLPVTVAQKSHLKILQWVNKLQGYAGSSEMA